MNNLWIFSLGLVVAMLFAAVAIAYLQPHLKAILIDLCGTKERAEFWTAFSEVTLFLTPMIFALRFRPEPGSVAVLVYGLSDQVSAALVGLVAAVVVLGFVLGRFIAREKAPTRTPPSNTSA
jgi:hypothetical protein